MDKQINKTKKDTKRVEKDLDKLSLMDKKFDKKIDKAKAVLKHKKVPTMAHENKKKAI